MVYVPVTDSERAKGKGQPVDGGAGESHERARVGTRARPMLAALSAVTQRARARRVVARTAADPKVAPWEADGLEEALADQPTTHVKVTAAKSDETGGGWWERGPLPPKQQWARFRGWLDGADHPVVRIVVVLLGLPITVAGIAAAGFVKLTQHPGGMALLTVVLGIWWAATVADAPPVVAP